MDLAERESEAFVTDDYKRGIEEGEEIRLKWIRAYMEAANGNLDPALVEEAARILED